MKRLIFIAALVMVLGSCGGDSPKSMFDTAQLEELQNNPKHAIEIYEEIVNKYPNTEFAKKSKERIEKLNQPAQSK